MPKPYSRELRERVVRAVKEGMSYDEAAEWFDVGRATVGRWLRRQREFGSVQPAAMGGDRRGKLDDEALGVLSKLVEEQPDRTLAELADQLAERVGVVVSLKFPQ